MLEDERRRIAEQVSALAGLTPGRTGNLSVRRGERVAITPSGVPYGTIIAGDVPVVSLAGDRLAGIALPPARRRCTGGSTGAWRRERSSTSTPRG